MKVAEENIFKRRRSESLIEDALAEGPVVQESIFKTKLQGCSKQDKRKRETKCYQSV